MREMGRERERERVSQSFKSIYSHSFESGFIPTIATRPRWEGVIKYAFITREEKIWGQGGCSAALFPPVQLNHSHIYDWKRYLDRRERKALWRQRDLRKLSWSVRERRAVRL